MAQAPVNKKLTDKQKLRLLLNEVTRLDKKYSAARSKAAQASVAKDKAWEELDKARIKVARAACPFKQGQILKHYKSGYAKVTRIEDTLAFKPPYFVMEGRRVKADHKTFIDKESKKLNPSDWEPLDATK